MRSFRLLALGALLPLLGGCHWLTGTPPTPADAVHVVDGLDAIPDGSDPVWIREARLVGNRLFLEVQYSGGCEEHDFVLYGTVAWVRTNPPLTTLHLHHDANGDACEALLTEDLVFSLRPLKQAWRRRFDYRGTVRIGIAPAGSDEAAFIVETTL